MRVRAHRTLDGISVPPPTARIGSPDLRLAVVAGIVAIGCLVLAGGFGDIHGPHLRQKIFAAAGAAGFLISSAIAIRRTANEIARVVAARTGAGPAGILRLVITLAGMAIAILAALGLLDVPVQHLLLGGALTGIIIGIAAQQSLGNVFAGLVLLLARPFNIGDQIRVKSGSLGGELTGTVLGMGLTYVTLDTPDGPLSIPNSGLLAAGIGPRPVQPPSGGPPDGPAGGP